MKSIVTLLGPLGLFAASTALAHHSDAVYDRETVVAFEGIVTHYSFSNPHVRIVVATGSENGDTVEWDIETGSTPVMIRSGWSADLVSVGDTVIVRAHPHRTGSPRAILNTLETTDGRVWLQDESDPDETVAATSVEGVWKGLNGFSLRRGLGQVPLTPAGRRRGPSSTT